MRPSTSLIRSLLAKEELSAIELIEIYYTPPFTTPDIRLAKWNVDVVWDSETYKSVVWNRSPLVWSSSTQDQRVNFRLDNVSKELAQLLFSQEISGGRVRLLEVFTDYLTDPTAYFLLFDGSFSTPSADENAVTVDAVSWLTRYGSLVIPRRIFQRQCGYQLYDSACTVDRTAAANVQSSTAQAGTTTSLLKDSNLLGLTTPLSGAGNESNYWDEGTVEFTTGQNTGQARPVRSYSSSRSEIIMRFPFANIPAVGDAYSIRRGCRKTKDDCLDRFNNLANFGGFAEVPAQKQSLT